MSFLSVVNLSNAASIAEFSVLLSTTRKFFCESGGVVTCYMGLNQKIGPLQKIKRSFVRQCPLEEVLLLNPIQDISSYPEVRSHLILPHPQSQQGTAYLCTLRVERPWYSNCSAVVDIKDSRRGSLELRPGRIPLALLDPCKSPSFRLRVNKRQQLFTTCPRRMTKTIILRA